MGQVYSNLKVLHYPEKLASLPLSAQETLAPIHIRIKPTNVCAHHCSYCAYRVDALQVGQDMNERDEIPRDKMMEIIDDVEQMGVEAVTFSGGGDPFYYKPLLDVVKRIVDGPLKFASLTNGAKLSGELAEIFAAHATWLRVSMDGWDDKSYADYRGIREGEFTKVLENMRAFKQLGGACKLGVSYIVDQKNAAHIETFVEKIYSLGVDNVKIAPCVISSDGKENNRYHEPIYNRVREQIDRTKERFSGENFDIYDAYHILDEKFDKEYHWCPYIQILPIIGADQHVYSCQDKPYNMTCGFLGSLKEQRFRDFWYGARDKFFDIEPTKECKHHCLANEKNKLILNYLDAETDHMSFV